MKQFYTLLFLVFGFHFAFGQIVSIPDNNFKSALLNHSPIIDTNGDSEIQVSEAESYTGILDVSYKGISNLEGIEAFIDIIELNANLNNLTELDITQNISLEILKFIHNDLTDIDLSNNVNLKEIWCNFNEFTTLDVSNNIDLEFISAPYMNTFNHIDISNNVNLESVFFGETQLSSLNVSNNPNLGLIQIINCPISSLDVSQNPLIHRLLLDGSQIQNIDVSNNPNLQYFHVNETPITTIDFSQNPNIWSFDANDCSNLQFINARNGQNLSMNTFTAINTPNLDYICVDDIAYAAINFDYPVNTVLTVDCENPTGDYNLIRGRLSFDFDNNGCDPNDEPVPYNMISSTNGADTYASFANDNGEYAIVVDAGVYNTEVIEYLSLFDVSPASATHEFTDYGNTVFQDFCFTANQSVSDVWLYMCVLEQSRPGYETPYLINVYNSGSTLSNGTIEFQFDDSKQSFVSASVEPVSQTSNTLVFSYVDLVPLRRTQILINMLTFQPPVVNGGELLNFTVTCAPDVVDQNPNDNTIVRSQTVVNSYDPNDKLVAQGEEVHIDDIDEYFIYTIRFQNTGTASAINVRLTDDLSDKLDWNTMTPIESSHNYNAQLTNENHLEVFFDDIYLPAQQDDDEGSNGYFIFKVKPKTDVQIGDVISGNADIFFDFNPPITTNTVNTEIVESLSVDEFDFNEVKLYPNPTKDILELTSNQVIDRLIIADINGRQLNSIELFTTDYSLNVSSLSNGIYFLEIQSGDSKSVQKFIKN